MSTHQVHVFISHSWNYSGHYDTLSQWVFGRAWRFGQASVDFRNYSVPREFPIVNAPTDQALREAIHRKITRSHVIVVPTGMYAHFSKWIRKEIDSAVYFEKPVLAVNLRGAARSSNFVNNIADECVGWSSRSVARGIWNLYYR